MICRVLTRYVQRVDGAWAPSLKEMLGWSTYQEQTNAVVNVTPGNVCILEADLSAAQIAALRAGHSGALLWEPEDRESVFPAGEVAAFRASLIAAGMAPSTADELLGGTAGLRRSQAAALLRERIRERS